MRKYKKKDLKRDEFKESIEELIVFYERHKKTVIWIASGVILLIIALLFYRNSVISNKEQARSNYNIGMVVYNSGQYQKALQQFQMVNERFWGTEFARRSVFMIADIYYKSGEIQKAIDNFQEFLKGEEDEYFTPSSYQGLAQCYEQMGDLKKAIDNYKEAYEKYNDKTFKVDCLFQLGRLYLSNGNMGEAEESYKSIISITDNPTLRHRAERKLQTIEFVKKF